VTCTRQSIRQRKVKAKKTSQISKRNDNFILSLGSERIQVVNGDNQELRLISLMTRSHCTVLREGWAKNMVYFFKLGQNSRP
jgi:hypothetical protein